MLSALTSSGTLPMACAASVWKKIFLLRQSAPISASGCRTPISLLMAMMETSAVSSRIAA